RIDRLRNIVLGHLEDEDDRFKEDGNQDCRGKSCEAAAHCAHVAQLPLTDNLLLEYVLGNVEYGDSDDDVADSRQEPLRKQPLTRQKRCRDLEDARGDEAGSEKDQDATCCGEPPSRQVIHGSPSCLVAPVRHRLSQERLAVREAGIWALSLRFAGGSSATLRCVSLPPRPLWSRALSIVRDCVSLGNRLPLGVPGAVPGLVGIGGGVISGLN